MDKFEQLTAYFKIAHDFHSNRHLPLSNVVALTNDLPELAAQLSSPKLIARVATMMAINAPLLDRANA